LLLHCSTSSIHAVVPPPPSELLVEQFRHAVLDFLYEEGGITDAFRQSRHCEQSAGRSGI
jgi:hypothetical protein